MFLVSEYFLSSLFGSIFQIVSHGSISSIVESFLLEHFSFFSLLLFFHYKAIRRCMPLWTSRVHFFSRLRRNMERHVITKITKRSSVQMLTMVIRTPWTSETTYYPVPLLSLRFDQHSSTFSFIEVLKCRILGSNIYIYIKQGQIQCRWSIDASTQLLFMWLNISMFFGLVMEII